MVDTDTRRQAGPRAGVLAAAYVLLAALGVGLAFAQRHNIVAGMLACWDQEPGYYTDAGDRVWVNLLSLVRMAGYPAVLLLVGAPFLAAARHDRRPGRSIALLVATVLIVAGAMFWLDYEFFNSLELGMIDEARCPGGRPPWWPTPAFSIPNQL